MRGCGLCLLFRRLCTCSASSPFAPLPIFLPSGLLPSSSSRVPTSFTAMRIGGRDEGGAGAGGRDQQGVCFTSTKQSLWLSRQPSRARQRARTARRGESRGEEGNRWFQSRQKRNELSEEGRKEGGRSEAEGGQRRGGRRGRGSPQLFFPCTSSLSLMALLNFSLETKSLFDTRCTVAQNGGSLPPRNPQVKFHFLHFPIGNWIEPRRI